MVHTSEGVTTTEDATEREKLFELKENCEHLLERNATQFQNAGTTNKGTVRQNDAKIAIEIRKNACEFAELSSEGILYSSMSKRGEAKMARNPFSYFMLRKLFRLAIYITN